MSTLIIAIAIAAIVFMIVRNMVHKARAGKSVTCDSCGSCALGDACPSRKAQLRASGKPVIPLQAVHK